MLSNFKLIFFIRREIFIGLFSAVVLSEFLRHLDT